MGQDAKDERQTKKSLEIKLTNRGQLSYFNALSFTSALVC